MSNETNGNAHSNMMTIMTRGVIAHALRALPDETLVGLAQHLIGEARFKLASVVWDALLAPAEVVETTPVPEASVAPPKRSHRAKPKAATKKTGEKRTPEVLEAISERMLAHLRQHKDGRTMEQIGGALGLTTGQLLNSSTKLKRSGRVRTTGAKRGMRYFIK